MKRARILFLGLLAMPLIGVAAKAEHHHKSVSRSGFEIELESRLSGATPTFEAASRKASATAIDPGAAPAGTAPRKVRVVYPIPNNTQ
jgi:hypothetical protein